MECKKAYVLIQDFIDGILRSGEREAFERHMAACPKCAAELEAHRSLDAFLGELDVEEVPSGFGERVISHLKSTGRILDPSLARRREGRVWTRLFDWVPARFKAPAAAVAVVLITISAASILSGQFKGFVGKSAVLATDTYIGVEDAMASVDVVDRFFERVGSDLRTAKTVVQAGLTLLSSLGETLMLPALAVFLLLSIGIWWYFRTAHRRSAQNASFIF